MYSNQSSQCSVQADRGTDVQLLRKNFCVMKMPFDKLKENRIRRKTSKSSEFRAKFWMKNCFETQFPVHTDFDRVEIGHHV